MRRGLLGGCAASALSIAIAGFVSPAQAQDTPKPRTNITRAPYNWSGAYIGFNTGAALGQFDTSKTTTPSATYISNPANVAAINAAGQQRINHSGFTGGLQVGYNWQIGRGLIGIEADLNYLNMGRSTTSRAVRYPVSTGKTVFGPATPVDQFIVYSYTNADWLLMLRPRVGVIADNWLFYATGGLALTYLKGQLLFADGSNPNADSTNFQQQSDFKGWVAGYTVGGGVETAISDRLRLKAEYSFVDFPTVHPQETSNNLAIIYGPSASQSFSDQMKLRMHLFRVGLNYAFSHPGAADNSAWASSASSSFLPKQIFGTASDWEFDIGARTWFSSGTIGAPQALLGAPPAPSWIISRLTYENVRGLSGETFARLDHRSGWFVKGFLGAGAATSGTLVDEDFPGFNNVYSNTVSPLKGNFGYANIDFGYSFFRAPGARVGAFIGYNYFTQHMNGFGCNQVALNTLCVGTDPNYQVFGEDQRYDALRVGLTAEFWLSNRLKFSAEAAYLPYISFRAQDDHNQRQLFIQESSSNGDGTMLEAILSYAVTSNWSVGVGGRLWAWNMHDGMVSFDYPGHPIAFRQIGRYNTERYGVFLQTDYRFGDVTRPAHASADATAQKPMDWTGVYFGSHVGGAVANNEWSDPFPSARTGLATNSAGFGNTIHSTGPLMGVQAGINWQHGSFVAGIKGAWSKTSLRGENTCYSGVGGLNCQNIINSVATLTGRIGTAWNRVLFYAEGGAANGQIEYRLNGNTNFQSRGYGVTSISPWGWTAGGGLEYALTDNWTTMVEYQHIDLGTNHVLFPTVALVKLQDNTIKQTVDLFRLGVNYKLDWRAPPVAQN